MKVWIGYLFICLGSHINQSRRALVLECLIKRVRVQVGSVNWRPFSDT